MCNTRIIENTLINKMEFIAFVLIFFSILFFFRKSFVSQNKKVVLKDIAAIMGTFCGMFPIFLIVMSIKSFLYNDNRCIAKGCFDGNIIYNSILFFLFPLLIGMFLYKPIINKYRKLSGSKKHKFKKYLAVILSILVVIILILYLNFILYGYSFDVCSFY